MAVDFLEILPAQSLAAREYLGSCMVTAEDRKSGKRGKRVKVPAIGLSASGYRLIRLD